MKKLVLLVTLAVLMSACGNHKPKEQDKVLNGGNSTTTVTLKEPQVPVKDSVVPEPKPKVPEHKVPKSTKVHKVKRNSKPVAATAPKFTTKQIIEDCRPDFIKTQCVAQLPDRNAVHRCMVAHKSELAPLCRRHLP